MLEVLSKVGRRGAVCLCVVCRKPFETKDRFIAKAVHAGDQCEPCKYFLRAAPTQALLLQAYNYDPETGELTYKRDFSRRHKGEPATTTSNTGYLNVTLDKSYLAHRIIWMMQTGSFPQIVDHINHIRTDNRWVNLREVGTTENVTNRGLNRNNKSGTVGVSFMKSHQKWRATITVNYKSIHLGLFATEQEAAVVRLAAEQQYNFHANHGK